jgi:Protein of unknown function (DUF1587)/Planctomycete cytochrome C
MRSRIEQRAVHNLVRGLCCPAVWASAVAVCVSLAARAGTDPGAAQFHNQIQPILQEYCFDCHGDGAHKGSVAFDEFKADEAILQDHELWWKALKNLRAGLMPPPGKPRPDPEQKNQIERWIKTAVFKADPQNPDPGRVTVRRLNRVEYRNTIRDLMGVDFDTEKEFPPDDAGFGFDNIGDVLTLPPMLLEKYLAAAMVVVTKAVPADSAVPAEKVLWGRSFIGGDGTSPKATEKAKDAGPRSLSYYEAASVTNRFGIEHGGQFQVILDYTADERFVDNKFDYNKCRLIFRADGHELFQHEYTRESGKAFHQEFDQDWIPGEHELVLEVQPLTPDQKQVRSLSLRIDSVTVRGPLDRKYWVRPKNYERFFPREVPRSGQERRAYASEILGGFTRRAYRRPVTSGTIDRLVGLAEATYSEAGKTFEAGIG